MLSWIKCYDDEETHPLLIGRAMYKARWSDNIHYKIQWEIAYCQKAWAILTFYYDRKHNRFMFSDINKAKDFAEKHIRNWLACIKAGIVK